MKNKKELYTLKKFIVGVVIITITLINIFSFTSRYGFDSSKYYALSFLVILLLFIIYHIDYKIRYNKRLKTFEEEENFGKILYHLMVDLKNRDIPKQDMYDRVLSDAIESIVSSSAGTISMVDEENNVKFVSVVGFDKNILSRIPIKLEETYLYKSTKGGLNRPIIVDNSGSKFKSDSEKYISDISFESEKPGIFFDGNSLINFDEMKTSLIAPIKVNGKFVGSLNLDSKIKHSFDEKDKVKAESFAFNIGTALETYIYFKDFSDLTQYDQMTKVYNREHFRSIHEDIHNKGDFVSYIYASFDLRRLRNINENYGRNTGDKVIKEFILAFKKIMPENIIIGRYAGDEFNCILINVSKELAKTMFKTLEDYLHLNTLKVGDDEMSIEFDYGMAIYPSNTEDIEELIKIAEYDRKKNKNYKYKEN